VSYPNRELQTTVKYITYRRIPSKLNSAISKNVWWSWQYYLAHSIGTSV